MRKLKPLHLASAVVALAAVVAVSPARAADPVNEVRLYTLDCGRFDMKDMGFFSDTGEYSGKPGTVVDPCYVIRHPKGTLLWDTGLEDKLADSKGGVDNESGHLQRDVKLIDELKSLGLTPTDITYVAFSHFHFDHTGNANEFPGSTWILSKAELNWATSTPSPFGVMPDSFSAYKTVKTQMIDGDYDVFGDGSVRILKMPGHTPGHQSLMLKLHKTGTVLLSGDLYHLKANRQFARVPSINTDRADTLASINRFETLVRNTKARVIVQHDPADLKALPKAPAYLD